MSDGGQELFLRPQGIFQRIHERCALRLLLVDEAVDVEVEWLRAEVCSDSPAKALQTDIWAE